MKQPFVTPFVINTLVKCVYYIIYSELHLRQNVGRTNHLTTNRELPLDNAKNKREPEMRLTIQKYASFNSIKNSQINFSFIFFIFQTS